MISLNLIKSEDVSVIEFGEMVFYERGLEYESTNQKSMSLTLISQRN